jgi:dGTPase
MPSLEAQIISLADEIAYNNHDLDDGISSGILDIDEVADLTLWRMALERYPGELPCEKKLLTRIIVRNIINLLASDLIDYTFKNIEDMKIKNYMDVKNAKAPVAGFSSEVRKATGEIKEFLKKKLYQHYRVTRMSIKAEKVIREMFNIYTSHPETLPEYFEEWGDSGDIFLTITDYIAGMTDRFAIEEYKKLTDPEISV